MRKLAQLLAGVLWVASCGAGGMAAAEEDDVKAVLQAYEAAWSRHDADAVAAFYYEPAMRVSRSGPAVRATRAEQRAFFEGFLRGLVERGYAKSEWEELDVRLLDSQTALASGITVRYREDGSLLERVAVTYALRLSDQGWKIFMSATHAPQSVLRFR